MVSEAVTPLAVLGETLRSMRLMRKRLRVPFRRKEASEKISKAVMVSRTFHGSFGRLRASPPVICPLLLLLARAPPKSIYNAIFVS